ncbi:hypothetical protein [Streptomyces sp. V4I8]
MHIQTLRHYERRGMGAARSRARSVRHARHGTRWASQSFSSLA